MQGLLDKVNQRNWREFALAVAGQNATPYASLFEFSANTLFDEMKNDGVVLK